MDAKLRSAGVCPAAKSFLRLRPDNTTSMHHQRILTEHKRKKRTNRFQYHFWIGEFIDNGGHQNSSFFTAWSENLFMTKKGENCLGLVRVQLCGFFAAIRSFLLCTWLENYLSKNQCIKHDHFYFASRFYARAAKCLFFPSCRVVAHFMVLLELH